MFNLKFFLVIFLVLIYLPLSKFYADAPEKGTKQEQHISNWKVWKKNLINTLGNSGEFKKKTISKLKTIKYVPKVVKFDRNQPEFKLTLEEYFNNVTPEIVVSKGIKNKKLILDDLNLISKKYKVDPNILIALWGIESFYGKNVGDFNIVNSLASLSFEGRRKDFFFNQLKNSLKIIEENNFSFADYTGSWAGAYGQTQFMPSTYVGYAVDYDGDGIKDLKNNTLDAIASGANYLNQMGWKNTLAWGEEFKSKSFKFSAPKKNDCKPLSFWNERGFQNTKKYPKNICLRLLKPEKNIQKYFLVSSNFDILLKWNRSNFFALAVGKLSDDILGE